MTLKDFWPNSKVGIVGGGSWGTVLAQLVSRNCREVRIWMRDERVVRSINTTRANAMHFPSMKLNQNIYAYSDKERFFEGGIHLVLWALPSEACRGLAKEFSPFLRGDELLLHATKGVEPGSMKRISQVLTEELPCRRVGVISGPNLAHEIAKGEPTATVVASVFSEVCDAGQSLLSSDQFRTYRATDIIGVEWAGTLKNILAIASGALDALKLGWNARAMLMTRGLAEMVRFGIAMNAEESTFLGLAGVGDVLATCSSSLSRNYQVGYRLAKGEKLEQVLAELGSIAEGVRTTRSVWEYASQNEILMPITEGVYRLIKEGESAKEVLKHLMNRPTIGKS